MSSGSNQDLEARVCDIEKRIGDIWEIFSALKIALGPIPLPPTCPPYCGHNVENEEEDPLLLPDRVNDIKKYVGDFKGVFDTLKEQLERIPLPTCPPYCGEGSIVDPEENDAY